MCKLIFNFLLVLISFIPASYAFGAGDDPVEFRLGGKPLMYEPEVERRRVKIPRIDSEFFEIGPYAGLLSIEDFGANVVTGVRLILHPVQYFFIEGAHGRSSISDETYRKLTGNGIFSAQNGLASLNYSYAALGINIMPGEIFLGRSLALTSGVYLLAGLGAMEFDRDKPATVVYGMGLRVLPIDWIALHMDVRGFEFKYDRLGRAKVMHNVELNAGASVYF